MVVCDLASAALIAVMALPAIPIPAMLALLTLVSVLSPISAGARSALLPEIVGTEAYVPARSLFRLVAQSGQVVGNALGGLLLVVVTARHALLIDAASFLASALAVRFGTQAREPTATATSKLLTDSLQGIKDVFAHPAIRRLLAARLGRPDMRGRPRGARGALRARRSAGPRRRSAGGW